LEMRRKNALLPALLIVMIPGSLLLADDVIHINFQKAGSPKPLRTGIVHLEDSGESYGNRGNGYEYGWTSDMTDESRRRYEIGDCRLDGHVRLGSSEWEIALDNGDYLVNIAFGDPKYNGDNSFTIEGVNYDDPDGDDYFDIYENLPVTVSGGELRVEDNSADPKICYIEIVDAAIGFPPKETFPFTDPNQPAFPGAEGFAKNLTGGRGGDVYHVTNLNWDGPGSLQEGFLTTYDNYPRTVVFDVSGTIGCSHPESVYGDPNGCNGADGDMNFNGHNITVAGQTAPGKGITIRDHTVKINNSGNIIMRYFRIRLGDENKGAEAEPDGLTTEDNNGLFLDHISMSWSIDGMWDSRRCGNMSVQWCIFAEPLNDSLHPKGEHGYLMSFRNLDADVSIHHNLFSSGSNRHPTLGSNEYDYRDYLSDFRNNINYNWRDNMRIGSVNHNIINNTFRFGHNGFGNGTMLSVENKMDNPWGYLTGNVWESIDSGDATDCSNFTADNYLACLYSEEPVPSNRIEFEAFTEFTVPGYVPPVTGSANDSFQSVVNYAGCSLVRDTVDERIINNVINSTGNMIDSQDDVGGWDDYPSETRPADFDTDQDGMADAWEAANGLNSDNAGDRNGYDLDPNYTNLEVYLNGLVKQRGADMTDLAVLAEYWQSGCGAIDQWCEGMDYNYSGGVDINDLQRFAFRWLRIRDPSELGSPGCPTNLSAAPGDGQVSLDWDENSESDLSGYDVYCCEISGGPYSQMNGSLVQPSEYVDNTANNGTMYYYVVTAVDIDDNESGYSQEVSARPIAADAPCAPSGLSITEGYYELVLDWNDNTEGDLAGYNVYRSMSSAGGYSEINSSLVTQSAYTDNDVTGNTYYYVVTAVDTDDNESEYSEEVSGKPDMLW